MENETVQQEEMFTRSQLVAFGCYMVSDRRLKRMADNWDEGDSVSLTERCKEVYHADIENFKSDLHTLSTKVGSGE